MSDSETSKPRSNKSKRRSLLKWIKRSLWIAAALGLLAMIVVAFLPKPVLVDVVEVERGALRVTVDEDGRSRVSDRYVLSAPLTGNLGRIELDPGDDVGEGEVIARLVPLARPLMDAQSRAEAEARVAAAAASDAGYLPRSFRTRVHILLRACCALGCAPGCALAVLLLLLFALLGVLGA